MPNPNIYLLGTVTRISSDFESSSGTPLNPTAVLVKVKKGNNSPSTFVYGTDVEVKRDVTGTYYLDVNNDVVGLYTYLWYATGTGQTAGQKNYIVEDSIGN